MNIRTILLGSALVCAIAACDDSSSSEPTPTPATIADVLGLWHIDTAFTENGATFRVSAYVRFDSAFTIATKSYTTGGGIVDSSTGTGTWRLEAGRMIATVVEDGETFVDTSSVGMLDGKLVVKSLNAESYGETETYVRAAAIVPPTR